MFTKFLLVALLSLAPGVSMPANFDTQNNNQPADNIIEIQSDLPRKTTDSIGVKLDAKEAIVLDYKTKKIIFEKNAHDKIAPASLTKIMTALVVLDQKDKLDEPIRVSKKSTEMIERTIGLEEGEIITLKDLLAAALITSANDAAQAIADSLFKGGEKKFVAKMNEKAEKMGLTSSHFENTTGLDSENHYSSAYDLALLFREAVKNSTFREIISKKEYEFQTITPEKKHKFEASNRLLRDGYPRVIGGKTGFTDNAGFCLANLAENKDGNQIISVVLGASENGNQFQDTKGLIEWTYNNYQWKE